jgi:F0F1-type ATP synthase assembly protein I
MYWPLIGGFIAVVLLTILIGWILDSSRRRNDARNEGH